MCARGEPLLLAIPCENFGLVTGTNVCDKNGCFPPPPPRLQTGKVVPPLDAPPPQVITSLLSAGLTFCRLHWLEEGNTPPPQDAILYYSLSFLPYAPPPHSKIPLHSQLINKSINPHSYFEKNSTRISSFSYFSSLSFSFCCCVFFSSRSRTRFRHREARDKSNNEAYIRRKSKNRVYLNSRKRVACRRKSRWDLEQRRRRRSARARAFSLLALLR
jgi:hypothetical protein